jgi:hypothetical protein
MKIADLRSLDFRFLPTSRWPAQIKRPDLWPLPKCDRSQSATGRKVDLFQVAPSVCTVCQAGRRFGVCQWRFGLSGNPVCFQFFSSSSGVALEMGEKRAFTAGGF